MSVYHAILLVFFSPESFCNAGIMIIQWNSCGIGCGFSSISNGIFSFDMNTIAASTVNSIVIFSYARCYVEGCV